MFFHWFFFFFLFWPFKFFLKFFFSMPSHKEKLIQILPVELETNKQRKDSGMFKGKMKCFSVYWKEKPIYFLVGIETLYLSLFSLIPHPVSQTKSNYNFSISWYYAARCVFFLSASWQMSFMHRSLHKLRLMLYNSPLNLKFFWMHCFENSRPLYSLSWTFFNWLLWRKKIT